jgi:endo-beta-N-acetylglucosaminidase D
MTARDTLPADDGPYSVSRGRSERNGYVLTHAEWHPCHMDVDIAQYESGLHHPDGTFDLIQHGMRDFDRAEQLIWRAVDKGWDASRMTDVLRYLRDRRTRARLL